MPFTPFLPRPYSVTSVRANAPAAPGIYALSNAREWIYIGETRNIQASLMEHLAGTGGAVAGRHPTGFVFELCGTAGQTSRCARLMLEYEPVCNHKLRP